MFNDSKVIQNTNDEVGIVAIRNCICHSVYTIRENKEVVVDFHGALHIIDLNCGNTKGARNGDESNGSKYKVAAIAKCYIQ